MPEVSLSQHLKRPHYIFGPLVLDTRMWTSRQEAERSKSSADRYHRSFPAVASGILQ